MARPWWSSTPDESGVMLRWVNWVARAFGLLWLGMLAFVFYPPPGGGAVAVQAAGFAAAGLGLVAWTVLEGVRRAAPYRGRLLPAVLGLIAAGAGAAASAASVGGLPLVIFAFVATMAAGSDLSVAAALGATAAGVLATEVSGLAFSDSIGTLVGLPLVVASGAVIGRNRGAYRIRAEQAAALLAQREQLEAEQRRADLLDERTRIAREIHDVLAHSLGALSIQIQAARSVLTDRGDIDRASELLTAAQRMAAEGLTETRRAVHALREGTLPLDQELARATDTYAQRYQVAARFAVGGALRPVPADATIALLRVAQEALVNAAKHSAGQAVTVRLDYREDDVQVVVRNNLAPASRGDGAPGGGPPGDAAPGPDGHSADGRPGVRTADAGYGLTGMRERLRILDGTLEAGSRDGQWIVTARLPLPRPESMAS
jgi:signal transduction histidine kinase